MINSNTARPLVRFYLYQHKNDPYLRLQFACKLVEKAQNLNQRVAILCTDKNQSTEFNHQLWAFKPESFIPHCLSEFAQQHEDATAILYTPPERIHQADIIINLSLEPQVDIPKRSQRIFEIIIQEPNVLNATRKRYQHYQKLNLQPELYLLD